MESDDILAYVKASAKLLALPLDNERAPARSATHGPYGGFGVDCWKQQCFRPMTSWQRFIVQPRFADELASDHDQCRRAFTSACSKANKRARSAGCFCRTDYAATDARINAFTDHSLERAVSEADAADARRAKKRSS